MRVAQLTQDLQFYTALKVGSYRNIRPKGMLYY